MANLALAFDILANDKASKEFDKVGDSADKAGKKGTKFGTLVGAGLVAATAAVAEFGKKSIEAALEGEGAQARLKTAVTNTGGSFEELEPRIHTLSDGMAKFGFTNDEVETGLATLTTATGSTEKAMSLMGDAADLAKYKHIGLADASTILAKAQGGSTRAFKELGITMETGVPKTQALHDAMDQLQQKIGGQAAAAANTFSGKASAMHAQLSNVEEEIGRKLVPVIASFLDKLTSMISFVQRNSAVMGPLIAVVAALAAAVIAVTTAARIYTAVQTALDVVLSANPIGLIVIAIAALVAGVILAYKHSETFRNIVSGLWDMFKKYTVLGEVISHFGQIRDAIGWVIDKIEALIGALGRIHMPHIDLPHIPGFASGVRNFSGGLAVVGEQGPELAYLGPGTNILPAVQTASLLGGAGATAGGMTAEQAERLIASNEALRADIRALPRDYQLGVRAEFA